MEIMEIVYLKRTDDKWRYLYKFKGNPECVGYKPYLRNAIYTIIFQIKDENIELTELDEWCKTSLECEYNIRIKLADNIFPLLELASDNDFMLYKLRWM